MCQCQYNAAVDVEQLDYGQDHGGASVSQLPRPQQLTLAGSPTCADDDAQMALKMSDAISAEQAPVDRYGPRSASDARTRPADDSGTCSVASHELNLELSKLELMWLICLKYGRK